MGRLRIALCQLDMVVGDIDGNTAKVLAGLATAEEAGADLALFPELSLTGYPPEDLLLSQDFVRHNLRALDAVAASSGRCAAVVGFVDEDRELFNAAAVVAGGKVHGTWHKMDLPNYAVFDERRYFAPGDGGGPLFLVGGVRVGLTICEDVWSPTGALAAHAAAGAELVVSINASPYRAGVLAERERMLATRAADNSCMVAYVNLVGGQDELVFDGASLVFDIDGTLLARAPQFQECVLIADVDVRSAYRKRLLDPRGFAESARAAVVTVTDPVISSATAAVADNSATSTSTARTSSPPPVVPPLGATEEVYGALVLGLRDYVLKNGFGDVVIALSGGVDSALVAALAVDALGPERVHGVLMPSRFSSTGSRDDAAQLAENLGIETRVIPIEPGHLAFEEMLSPSFDGLAEDITEENLQSRVRGMVLMALSNKFGWLVLTTGNKSEMAVGYTTLYGDMAGGFAVIKDVPKLLVWELCRMRNAKAGTELIPVAIIDKPPSAELRPDQRDDQSLPPYEELDPIIEGYVELDRSVAELVADGHDEADVRRVVALIDRAEYKRRQAPPGTRVTSRAFGKDRRMPITNRYAPWTPATQPPAAIDPPSPEPASTDPVDAPVPHVESEG